MPEKRKKNSNAKNALTYRICRESRRRSCCILPIFAPVPEVSASTFCGGGGGNPRGSDSRCGEKTTLSCTTFTRQTVNFSSLTTVCFILQISLNCLLNILFVFEKNCLNWLIFLLCLSVIFSIFKYFSTFGGLIEFLVLNLTFSHSYLHKNVTY